MNKGNRFNQEGKLNYAKVFAVIIAIAVIIMCIAIVKNIIKRGKDGAQTEKIAKNYYALYSENKWGIIDSDSKTVIEPMYQEMIIVLNNKKDVFLCTYDVNEETGEYKTKVINKDNKELYTEYNIISPLENSDNSGNLWYEEDVFMVQKDGKYGLIDIDGKVILEPEYEEIYTLKGLKNSILIKKDGKFGLVNAKGAVIINPEYSSIEKFDDDYRHGYITVDSNQKYGLVSYAGSKILENNYEKIDQIYGENYFSIQEGGKQKIINSKGEKVLESGFDKITQINSDGLVFVKDNKYGFMNFDGSEIIKPTYTDLKEINTGILRFQKDGKYGAIDLEGNEKIKPDYKTLYYEENAAFYVGEKDNYISEIIDSEFNIKVTGVISELNKDKGYMKLKVDDEYKYYNFKFEEKQIKDIYSSNTLFVSKQDGKYGYVDKEGNVVVDYIYDEACEQNSYGFAAVKKDNLWGAIDSKGKEAVTPNYNLDNYLVIDFIGKWHLGQDLNMNYYCEK